MAKAVNLLFSSSNVRRRRPLLLWRRARRRMDSFPARPRFWVTSLWCWCTEASCSWAPSICRRGASSSSRFSAPASSAASSSPFSALFQTPCLSSVRFVPRLDPTELTQWVHCYHCCVCLYRLKYRPICVFVFTANRYWPVQTGTGWYGLRHCEFGKAPKRRMTFLLFRERVMVGWLTSVMGRVGPTYGDVNPSDLIPTRSDCFTWLDWAPSREKGSS